MVLVPYEYLGSWAPLVRKEDKVSHHKGFQMDELMSTFACLIWKCHLSVKGLSTPTSKCPICACIHGNWTPTLPGKTALASAAPRPHLLKYI